MIEESDRGHPLLLERIRARIRRDGPLSFRDFMEMALHDPDHGYYAGGSARLGEAGDFYTASDVGTAFGRCTARQLAEMDRLLGHPLRFDALEFGAGRGLLARDVLDAVPQVNPGFAGRLRYTAVDRSPAMRRTCRNRLPRARVMVPGELGRGHVGCAIAVELFDALPVHRLRRRGGRLREVFVDLDADGGLVEREQPPLPQALGPARRYGAAPEEGDEAEVAADAPSVLASMARALDRGFVLIVDYGAEARRLYGPRHRRGTLLAYHRHATNEDYLLRVGQQDLTAHVNFSQLEDEARSLGLAVLGCTTQDRFLIANGILESFEDDPERRHDPLRVKRRMQAMHLIHPHAMGRRFRVLLLSKGLDPPPRPAGLDDPFR